MPMRLLIVVMVAVLAGVTLLPPTVRVAYSNLFAGPADIREVRQRVVPGLRARLEKAGFKLGSAAHIRVFKEEHQLEVWLQKEGTFSWFKTYPICNYSGLLGPKLKEGDYQSPEGFYQVDKTAMNPNSSYHLSFNLGFPNAYDRSHSRTGSYLMIHGNCVSIGCYAMTDAGIEEIYLIVEAAQKAGQKSVPVHAFPFKMTAQRLEQERASKWFNYWSNLKTGYDLFEHTRIPPKISVSNKMYIFQAHSP